MSASGRAGSRHQAQVRQKLSELPLWTEGIVESVAGPEEIRRRLLEMGFCNRARVTAIRRAPLGDPVEFRLRDYNVSLRRDEAECILVLAPRDGDRRPSKRTKES